MTDVVDLAAYGERFTADPYPVYAELRERGPVHRVRLPRADGPVEAWLVVGYEEAREALADPRLSKDPTTLGITIPEGELIGRHMLVADPPEHTRLRRLVAREFTARRVQALAPLVQRITDELLDAMVPLGRADLVQSFAFPLPLTVISELLGVPVADRAAFRRMSGEVVAPSGKVPPEANLAELGTFLDALIEEKRRSGTTGDLVGDLIRTADDEGDQLSSSELRAMAYLLLIAGHETTVNLIASGVHTLLRHPDQLAALRADPTLTEGAVEEILRYEGPIETATWRHTAEEVEFGGVRMGKNEPVLVSLASGRPRPGPLPRPRALRHPPPHPGTPRLRPRPALLPGRAARPPGGPDRPHLPAGALPGNWPPTAEALRLGTRAAHPRRTGPAPALVRHRAPARAGARDPAQPPGISASGTGRRSRRDTSHASAILRAASASRPSQGLASSPRATARKASSSAAYAGANRSRKPGHGSCGAAGPPAPPRSAAPGRPAPPSAGPPRPPAPCARRTRRRCTASRSPSPGFRPPG